MRRLFIPAERRSAYRELASRLAALHDPLLFRAELFVETREGFFVELHLFRDVAAWSAVRDGAAGALSALLFADERGMTVGHAPVVNCVAVTLLLAEAGVRIRELTGIEPSRGPSFALAPPGAIEEFRSFVRQGRGA